MEPITVDVLRGDVVEARHRVHAVAVSDGEVVASAGDPSLFTLFRSSAKPLQALPIVRARPDLDDAEIAIASASHLHRPDQLEPVRSLLEKANATEDELECGPEPTRIEHNCSGKHAAMLLLCRERGWPTEGYRLAAHPCQQELLAEVAAAARGRGRVRSDGRRRLRRRHLRLHARADGTCVRPARATRRRIARRGRDARASRARAWRRCARHRAHAPRRLGVEGRGGGTAVRRARRRRHRAQGRGRSAAPARAGARERFSISSGSSSAGLADAPLTNSRGEVVGSLRVTA